jgi:hypothetical protein
VRGRAARRPRGHAEQRADEILERPRQLDQQVRLVLGRQRVGRGARRHQPGMRLDDGALQPADESGIEAARPSRS